MQQLVDKYKPAKLAEFIGMDRARTVLSNLVNNPYDSAWLLVGPSGLGKTTMALAFAAEINAEVHHVASKACDLQSVNDICEKCHYVPMFGGNGWHVVIVDEADQMSHAAQLAFLSKLDGTATPPNTIFIFTANETKKLEDRFVSRCRTLKFSGDNLLEPLAAFLQNIWRIEAPDKAEPDFIALAEDACLNVRQALMDLEIELMMAAPAPAEVITAQELCKRLSVDLATIYKRVQNGVLPAPTAVKPMRWQASQLVGVTA